MIIALKIIIGTLSVFTAVGLLCAVKIGRRAKWANPAPADPYFHPFGEMPGLTAEQLARLAPRDFSHDPLRRSFAVHDNYSAGLALRPDAGSGLLSIPSGKAAARIFLEKLYRGGVDDV
jgi:hypothetical protein